MKTTKDIYLYDFDFWAGAADRAKHLTKTELDSIEIELEQIYPDGINETDLNDIFWFDFDFIAEMLGETEDTILAREADND